MRQIRTALDSYRQNVKDGRIEAAADASGYLPDLDALWQGVDDKAKPSASKLYFLHRLPRDLFFPIRQRRWRPPGACAATPARPTPPRPRARARRIQRLFAIARQRPPRRALSRMVNR